MNNKYFKFIVISILAVTLFNVQTILAQCNIHTDFTFTPNNSPSGTAISFQPSVQNAQGSVTYSWDFGDATLSTAANPVHAYTYTGCQPGTYNVNLTVTDTAGCTATQIHQVTVNNDPLVEMIDLDPISSFSNCENSPSLSNPSFTLDLQNGTQNPGSIASYHFDWGDGQTDTYVNSDFPVSYTYNDLGLFNLTVTATDTNGCTWDTTYLVSNQSNPAIGLSSLGYTQGCAPQTFQFVMSQYANNAPGTYYVWDFGDGSPTVTWNYNQPFINDTITHTFDTTSCYQNNNYFTVQVTAYNACDYTTATVSNIRIYLPPDPEIELLNDTVCAGDPVTFYNQTIPGFGYNCNQITAYNWNFGDSLSSNNTSSLSSPTHTYSQPGTYQVILEADNGICGIEEDTVEIVVAEPPHAVIDPDTNEICKDGIINFTNLSTGTNPITYQWDISHGNGHYNVLGSLTDSNLTVQFTKSGTFDVTLSVTNMCGTDDTTVTIHVSEEPEVSLDPIQDFCDSATINPTAQYNDHGSPIHTYTWTMNGGSPSTSTSSQPGSVTYNSPGTYTIYVQAENNCGTAIDSVTFNIYESPDVIATATDDTICKGTTTTLNATGAVAYNWSPASTLNKPSNASTDANPDTTTQYIVTGTDQNGCVNTDTINIYVNPLPNIDIDAIPGTICQGDTSIIQASGGNSYNWTLSTTYNQINDSTIEISPLTNKEVIVTGTDSNGCSLTDSAMVYVNPNPDLSFTPSNPDICIGDTVDITVTGASVYEWYNNGTLIANGGNIQLSPSSTTTYTVLGTDINGCQTIDSITVTVNALPVVNMTLGSDSICDGQSTSITATGASNYIWSPASSLNSNTGNTVTASPGITTTYTVTGIDNNSCQASDTGTVVVLDAPNIQVIQPQHICIGDSVMLTASSSVNLTWSPSTGLNTTSGDTVIASPASTTTYSVSGSNNIGCQTTVTTSVTVHPLPSLSFTPSNPEICLNDSVSITVSGADTYVWSPAQGLNSTTGSNVIASPSNNTIYTVNGSDIHGCSITDSIKVIVNPLPSVSIDANPSNICEGEFVQLLANQNNMSWSDDNGNSWGTGQPLTLQPVNSGTFYGMYTDTNGCQAIDSTNINVSPKPNLTYTLSKPSICLNDSLTITMSGAATYDWYIGNTNLPFTGASATVSPSSNTTYTVIGTSANGCLDTIDIPVTVNPLPVVAPSAANHDICTGDSVMLSASGANTYTWSPATSLNQNTGSNVMASPAATTTYTIVGTDINGCSADTTTIVTVNPLPVVDAQASVNEICPGGSTQLTATGAQAYNWSPATGLSSTTGNTVTASPATTTTYYATGISADGCEATDSVEIIVHPKPNLTYSLSQPSICNNDSLTITMSGAATYDWYIGNTNLPFTGASATVSPSSNTTYTVIGTSANGCQDTIDIPVTVNPLPVVAPSAANYDVCIGDSVMLSASGANTYTWSPATSLNQNTGSNVMASPAATTTYTIVGADINGCSADTTTTVTVNPLPVVDVQASDTNICLGQSVEIIAQGAQNYTWSPSATLNTNTNDTVIATPTSTTTYQVVGINSNGCENTSSITIDVNQAGPLTATPPNANICNGDTTTLTVSGALTYTWTNTPGLLQATGGQAQVSPASTTTYHVTGMDSNGCIRDVDIPVTVNPLPTVDANSNIASVCLGDTASLWGTGASNYDWYNNGNFIGSQNPISVNPVSTTTYYVEGTDVNGCSNTDSVEIIVNDLPNVSINLSDTSICLGDTAQATASGATTYSWQSNSTFTQLAGNMIELSPASNTQIIVQGTDQNGCSNSDSSVLHINQPPVLAFTPTSPQICNGDTIQLSVSGAVNYDWYKQGQFIGNGSNVTVFPSGNTFYTVIATDANGCQTIDSVMVEVIALPQLSLSATNDSICAGQTSTISVTGASSYIWNPSASLNASTGSTIQATPATTTTYYVEGSNSQGCKTTDSIDITVVPLPVLQVSPTADICQGDSATLTASGASVITWSPATGLSQTAGGQVIANPSSTTTYTVTGYNDFGCVDTATVTVNVHNIPNIALTPTNPQLCLGDSIQLNANGANTYTWTPSATLSSSTGGNVMASPATSTTYQVTGTTIHGCSNQNTITVDVIPTPNVSVSATPANVCQGSTVQLHSTESNTSWSNAQGVYIGSGQNMTILPTASETYYGTYTDVHGCHAIDSVQVNVSPTPSLSYSINKPYTCQGDSILIEVTGATNYIWFAGTTNLNIADSSAYLTPATSMTYTVVGENSAGCTDTIDIPISVQPLPSIQPLTASADICPGDTTLLSVSGANTYTWTPATGLSQTIGNTVFSSPVTTTNYTVEGTDIFGCTADTTIAVNVKPNPNIQVQASDTVICLGQSVTLTASGGQSYHWTPANSLNQNYGDTVQASPASTTTYYVTGMNSTGCTNTKSITVHVNIGNQLTVTPATNDICLGDTTTITVNGAVTYNWASNSGIIQINNNTATVSPNASTTYQVTGIDSLGCTHTVSIPVNVNMPPVITANTTSSYLCQGDSIQVWASGAQTYQWFANGNYISNQTIFTDNPQSATTYTVTGVDSNGCSSTASVNVNVNPIPSLSLSLSDSAICLGNSATLTASGGLNYNWTPSSTLNSATGTSVIATPSIGTTYHVTATSVHGCTAKDSVFLDVMPLPNVQLTAHPTNICKGDTVSLTASGAVNYNWNSNQLNTATIYETPDSTFTYTVTGVDSNGCSSQASQTIIVNPQPIPNFITDTIICKGTNLAINNTSVNASSFIWDFGDGTTSTASNPTHTYSSTGFYDIRLLATTAGGCQDSTLKTVQVIDKPDVNYVLSQDSGCAPLNVQFNNMSSGVNTSYTWNFGNGTTSGVYSPSQVTYPGSQYGDTSYVISLTGVNKCGFESQYDTVLVKNKPLASFNLTPDQGCSPLNVNFTNTSQGNQQAFAWDFGDGTSSGSANPGSHHYFNNGLNDTTYSVTLIAYNSCGTDTSNATVEVSPQTASADYTPSTQNGCAPLTVDFNNLSTGGTTMYWDFDDGNISNQTNPTHTFSLPGTYDVKLVVYDSCSTDSMIKTINVSPSPFADFMMNKDTICAGDHITFTNMSVNAANVTWKFGDGTISHLTNPVHQYTQSGLYFVTMIMTEQGTMCQDSVTKPVFVSPTPEAGFATSALSGCSPLDVQLSDTSQGAQYYYYQYNGSASNLPSPSTTFNQPGTYTVWQTVENSYGCIDSTSIDITVHPTPVSNFSLPQTLACDTPVTILINNQSIGAASYEWDFDNGKTSTVQHPVVSYQDPGTYAISLVATNKYMCSDTSLKNFLVSEPIEPMIGISAYDGCEPLSVQFANKSGNSVKSTLWDFGDSSVSSKNNPTHIYQAPGSYSVQLVTTNNDGCKDTLMFKDTINVYPKPGIGFNYTISNNPTPTSGHVEFTGYSPTATDWFWDFDDGTTSNIQNPVHQFPGMGIYNILLSVTNQYGCKNDTTGQIKLDAVYGLYVPNALSPTSIHEGVSKFKPKGKALSRYWIGIYDKWGNIIWESTELNNGKPAEGWDGTRNGKMLPAGVYVWKVEAVFENGTVWRGKKGEDGVYRPYGQLRLIR